MAVAEHRAKSELHALVEALSEDRARLLLRGLRDGDPVLVRLALAPEDDEPSTPEEEAGAEAAWEEYRRGEWRPWADVRRDLTRG